MRYKSVGPFVWDGYAVLQYYTTWEKSKGSNDYDSLNKWPKPVMNQLSNSEALLLKQLTYRDCTSVEHKNNEYKYKINTANDWWFGLFR